jgi:hypothetical protein
MSPSACGVQQRRLPFHLVLSETVMCPGTCEIFLFFDASSRMIDHASLSQRHTLNEVQSLKITWRYDKNAHNFTKRRFLLNAHPNFDPVDAGVSIIHRANLLGVPLDEPIGAWRPSVRATLPYRFVGDSDVSRIIARSLYACISGP